MKNKAGTILIADDQTLVVKGLECIIRANMPEMEIEHYSTFETALNASRRKEKIIVIIDFRISLGINLGLIQNFKDLNPNLDILIYSFSNENHYAVPYIQAGAIGYLSKMATEIEIITALNKVIAGGVYVSDSVRDYLIDEAAEGGLIKPTLSPRELQVSEMLIKGYTVLDISKILKIHSGTVSTFKIRVFKKLNVTNLIELAENLNIVDNPN